jgi:hypothetical protein
MTERAPPGILTPAHQKMLIRAVRLLEQDGLAAKIGTYAGGPAQRLLKRLPAPATAALNLAVEKAVLKSLEIAIRSLDFERRERPKTRLTAALTAVSGGLSGFLGLAALPAELPATTLLMLRSIASIARYLGEDLSTIEARLACVSVFAFGGHGGDGAEVGYYASRALLGKLSGDLSAALLQRGAAASPAMSAFVAEVSARYGPAVWERAALNAAPLIGAVGGASLNVIFTNHFHSIAWGHFTIRRLERIYGEGVIREHYIRIKAQ